MVEGIQEAEGAAETEDSIRNDLRTTYEEMAAEDSDEGGQATATAAPEPDGEDGEKDAEPDDAPGESDDDGQQEGEADEEPGDGSTDERLEAPAHWSAEHKATFDGLPTEGQAFLLERHRDMEADYTRRSQEVAATRRAFEPFQQTVAAAGTSVEAAVAKLADIHAGLVRDPEAEIRRLARENGVNLSPSERDEDDDYLFDDEDEREEGRRDSAADRERDERLNRLESKQSADAAAASNARIAEFAEATDSSGDLIHPHFAQVQEQMIVLATGYRATGKPYSLQSVYDEAVHLVPAVREQVTVNGGKTPNPDAKEEKRKKVERARNASRGARGTSRSPAPKDEVPDNIRDHLAQEYAALIKD